MPKAGLGIHPVWHPQVFVEQGVAVYWISKAAPKVDSSPANPTGWVRLGFRDSAILILILAESRGRESCHGDVTPSTD